MLGFDGASTMCLVRSIHPVLAKWHLEADASGARLGPVASGYKIIPMTPRGQN